MESIVIIVLGLLFSVLSKSAKDKKEIEKEREKRREQLRRTESETVNERKTKPLREIFMEELNNMGEEEGSLGDILKKSFNGNSSSQEVKQDKVETVTNFEYASDEEYYKTPYGKVDEYMKDSTIGDDIADTEVASNKSITETKTSKKTIKDNRQYNPFTKSLNRKDVIRGIIFSEVLEKPKSLRNEKRSM